MSVPSVFRQMSERCKALLTGYHLIRVLVFEDEHSCIIPIGVENFPFTYIATGALRTDIYSIFAFLGCTIELPWKNVVQPQLYGIDEHNGG